MDVVRHLHEKQEKLALGLKSLRKLEDVRMSILDGIANFLTFVDSNNYLLYSEEEFCKLMRLSKKRINWQFQNLHKEAQSGVDLLENTIRQLELEHNLDATDEQELLPSTSSESATLNNEIDQEQHVLEVQSGNGLLENTSDELEAMNQLNATDENLPNARSESATLTNEADLEQPHVLQVQSGNGLLENISEELEAMHQLNATDEQQHSPSISSESATLNNEHDLEQQHVLETQSGNKVLEITYEELQAIVSDSDEQDYFSCTSSEPATLNNEHDAEQQHVPEAQSRSGLLENTTEELEAVHYLNSTDEQEHSPSISSEPATLNNEVDLEQREQHVLEAQYGNDLLENITEQLEAMHLNATNEQEHLSSTKSDSVTLNNEHDPEQQNVLEAHSENDLLENTTEELQAVQHSNATNEQGHLSSINSNSESATLNNDHDLEQQNVLEAQSGNGLLENTTQELEAMNHLNTTNEQQHSPSSESAALNNEVNMQRERVHDVQSGNGLLENTTEELGAVHPLNTTDKQEHLPSISSESATLNNEVDAEQNHVLPDGYLLSENPVNQILESQEFTTNCSLECPHEENTLSSAISQYLQASGNDQGASSSDSLVIKSEEVKKNFRKINRNFKKKYGKSRKRR